MYFTSCKELLVTLYLYGAIKRHLGGSQTVHIGSGLIFTAHCFTIFNTSLITIYL